MDLSNSYDTKSKTPSLCKINLTDYHAKTDAGVPTRPYNLNLYYPLPRKSGSVHLSFPAQMCNLSNSDQKECMGIACHHAGNKDTFTCQNVTLHFMQKFSAKICRKKFMSQNQKQNILPQNLDAKYAPKIHAIEIGCKNLVRYYATKICTSKFNAKT